MERTAEELLLIESYKESEKQRIANYRKTMSEEKKQKQREANKIYYDKNKEKLKEKKKLYYHENRDKLVEKKRIYYQNNKEKKKEYDNKNKEKIKEYRKQYNQTESGIKSRRISRWKHSGVICEDWNELYNHYLRTSYCDICKVELTYDKQNTSTTKCLDHCHQTGQVRNILCHSCNTKRGQNKF